MSDETTILYRARLLRDATYEKRTLLSLYRNRPERYEPHQNVANVVAMRSRLCLVPEYEKARHILICDDGVASRLWIPITWDRKQCYFLDPTDGLVLRYPRRMLGGSHWDVLHRPGLFTDLPPFNLFLTGCHGIDQGNVYTGGLKLVWALNRLVRAGRITDRACNVVICNPDHQAHEALNDLWLMRAQYAITGVDEGVRCYRRIRRRPDPGKEGKM